MTIAVHAADTVNKSHVSIVELVMFNPALPNADDPRERKEMRGVVTRAAMKNMTIPQAKVFALEVELYTDKYVQQLTAKASLQRAIDELKTSLHEYERTDFETGGSDSHQHYLRDRIAELQAELQQAGKGEV